jgi:hypothetical protein
LAFTDIILQIKITSLLLRSCYTESMQPESPNYWHQDDRSKPDSTEITGSYAPQPDDDAIQNSPVSRKPKHEYADDEPLHWSDNEYIVREKNGLWFVALFMVAAIMIAADFVYLKSYTFSLLVVVMVAAIIVYSRWPPRLVDYTLSGANGLYIGDRLYHFSEFKSFGILQEKDVNSIVLIPVKRFSPAVAVYFPSEVGEKLVDIFGARLPMQKIKTDFFDVIIRQLGI